MQVLLFYICYRYKEVRAAIVPSQTQPKVYRFTGYASIKDDQAFLSTTGSRSNTLLSSLTYFDQTNPFTSISLPNLAVTTYLTSALSNSLLESLSKALLPSQPIIVGQSFTQSIVITFDFDFRNPPGIRYVVLERNGDT